MARPGAELGSRVLKDWPDDVLEAHFNQSAAEESVRLAESISAILEQVETNPQRKNDAIDPVRTITDP